MVLRYGMDKNLGHVAYERERPPMLGAPMQPNQYGTRGATGILNTHRAVHEKTAQVLLQQKTLEGGRYRETARADRFRG